MVFFLIYPYLLNRYFSYQNQKQNSTTFYIQSNITQQTTLFLKSTPVNSTIEQHHISETSMLQTQVFNKINKPRQKIDAHQKAVEIFETRYDLDSFYNRYAVSDPNDYFEQTSEHMSNCQKMLILGHWNESSLNLTGISRFNGKVTNHPFSRDESRFDRGRVKFQGNWVNGFCQIEELAGKKIEQCFGTNQLDQGSSKILSNIQSSNSKTTKILVLGDSRARQLTRAIQVYLTNSTEFLDPHDGASLLKLNFDIQINPSTSVDLMYRWSLKLNNSFKGLVCQLELMFSEIDKSPETPTLIVISEHLLHLIQHCWDKECLVKPDAFENWIDENVVGPFKNEYLPRIVDYLQKYKKLEVIFTAAAYRIYNCKPHFPKFERVESWYRNLIGSVLVDEYNRQLSKLILERKHKRLKWLGVANGVTVAPKSYQYVPLLADGTHLANRNEVGGLVSSHKTLVQIIFNSYCEDKIVFSSNSCCA